MTTWWIWFYFSRVDPYSKKDWYDVKAPSMFNIRQIGKTLVTRTQGTSKCRVIPNHRLRGGITVSNNLSANTILFSIKFQGSVHNLRHCAILHAIWVWHHSWYRGIDDDTLWRADWTLGRVYNVERHFSDLFLVFHTNINLHYKIHSPKSITVCCSVCTKI